MKAPRLVVACTHCGQRHAVAVRSLKLRPTRRCARCGKPYTPTQEGAA